MPTKILYNICNISSCYNSLFKIRILFPNNKKQKRYLRLLRQARDRAERHGFRPRLLLFFSPFLFPPKKKGEKKRRRNNKNHDQKSFLSARSFSQPCTFLFVRKEYFAYQKFLGHCTGWKMLSNYFYSDIFNPFLKCIQKASLLFIAILCEAF